MTPGVSPHGTLPALFAAALAVFVVWTQISASIGLRTDPEETSFRDFGSLWASGDAANHGLNPYAEHPLTFRVRTPSGQQPAVNLNPPFSVLLLQPLAVVDPKLMLRVWQAFSALLYIALVLLLVRRFPALDTGYRVLLALLWQPMWSTLDLGQVYVALLVPVALFFLLLPRDPIASGICIGLLVALKPQYAIWPLLLLAARHTRLALVAVLTALPLSLLPAALGHLDWYGQWVEASRASAGALLLADNLSLLNAASRLRLPLELGVALIALGLMALGLVAARRRMPALRVSAVALVAAMLASPVSWIGYGTLLVPVFLARSYWSESLLIAAILLAVPAPLLWWTIGSGFLVYEAALMLCLGSLLREDLPRQLPRSASQTSVDPHGDSR